MSNDLRGRFPRPCDAVWEDMRPDGCDRFCARCDRTVHDLSQLDIDEVQALVRRDPESCVRAIIQPDGAVRLRVAEAGQARRLMVATTAAVAMLAAGAPALAESATATGSIAGKVSLPVGRTEIAVTDADGRVYRGRVKGDGRYRVRRLPPGTYTVTFTSDCGDPWTLAPPVIVTADKTAQADSQDRSGCIVVGLLRLDGAATAG